MKKLELVSPKEARKPCLEINNFEDIQKLGGRALIGEMINFCMQSNGIGLAAPQVGIKNKFFVAYLQEFQDWKLFINPVYKPLSDQIVNPKEGCLTHGNENSYIVPRHFHILATWYELDIADNLVLVNKELTGISSVIFQHETDHTNGTTIASKGTKVKEKAR